MLIFLSQWHKNILNLYFKILTKHSLNVLKMLYNMEKVHVLSKISPKVLPASRARLQEWRQTVKECFCCKAYHSFEFCEILLKSLTARL